LLANVLIVLTYTHTTHTHLPTTLPLHTHTHAHTILRFCCTLLRGSTVLYRCGSALRGSPRTCLPVTLWAALCWFWFPPQRGCLELLGSARFLPVGSARACAGPFAARLLTMTLYRFPAPGWLIALPAGWFATVAGSWCAARRALPPALPAGSAITRFLAAGPAPRRCGFPYRLPAPVLRFLSATHTLAHTTHCTHTHTHCRTHAHTHCALYATHTPTVPHTHTHTCTHLPGLRSGGTPPNWQTLWDGDRFASRSAFCHRFTSAFAGQRRHRWLGSTERCSIAIVLAPLPSGGFHSRFPALALQAGGVGGQEHAAGGLWAWHYTTANTCIAVRLPRFSHATSSIHLRAASLRGA